MDPPFVRGYKIPAPGTHQARDSHSFGWGPGIVPGVRSVILREEPEAPVAG